MKFEEKIKDHETRKRVARAMGGADKLAKRAKPGVLNARERIDHLLDKGSFRESGLFGVSYIPEMRESTPADGKVTGFGKVDGRRVGVVGYDFTVKGSSSSYTNNRKMSHVKDTGGRRGFPVVFLGESTGVRMPDIMGEGMGMNFEGNRFLRTREAPWAAAILGNAFGSAAWHACCSDFCVMRKGAIMAVSSPRLISMATGKAVDGEELGGWRVHAEQSGLVDQVVDTDEQAIEAIKQFLSYLPSHHMEAPPEYPVMSGSDDAIKDVMKLVPDASNQVYDMRKVVTCIVDRDSMFELKSRFGKTIVTALARLDGKSIGVIANNPLYKGGAIDADACQKVQSFMVLCDSFNIPLVLLVDQPGFLIGIEGERQGVTGKVMNWLNAMTLCSVPKISIILRKSYGLAVSNMGAGGNADEVCCWVTAEVSFMKPEFGARVVFGVSPEEPEKYQQAVAKMNKGSTPYDMAAIYTAQNVIDPRDTREYLKRTLQIHRMRLSNGVGEHLMRTWPTSF